MTFCEIKTVLPFNLPFDVKQAAETCSETDECSGALTD
jgi:hypothetical protein